jgi:hypothetical protein
MDLRRQKALISQGSWLLWGTLMDLGGRVLGGAGVRLQPSVLIQSGGLPGSTQHPAPHHCCVDKPLRGAHAVVGALRFEVLARLNPNTTT